MLAVPGPSPAVDRVRRADRAPKADLVVAPSQVPRRVRRVARHAAPSPVVIAPRQR